MRSAAALAFALLVAGCLGGGEPAATESAADVPLATRTADGGVAGPREAVRVASEDGDGVTFHPYDLAGGRARAPEFLQLTGRFEAKDCSVPAWVEGVTDRFQGHDILPLFERGDVVHFDVWMNYTNTDQNWADLHLFVDLPGGGTFVTEDHARERGPISQNWTSQIYWRGDAGDRARVGVACFYGANPSGIDYTITVRAAYAENVVPASTPVLVRVPDGATRLLVTGVPVTGEPVTSHYRLFGPDDMLLGEYALNSNERVDVAFLPGPGDHVLIVDHTEGGFVSVGTDAPPEDPELVALDTGFDILPILVQDAPGPAAATVAFTLPRVPLELFVFPEAHGSEPTFAFGRDVVMEVEGPRGTVLYFRIEGFAEAEAAGQNTFAPAGLDFELRFDHHALAQGDHVASLDATVFRGELDLVWSTYLRPGEEGGGPPTIAPEGTFKLPLGLR